MHFILVRGQVVLGFSFDDLKSCSGHRYCPPYVRFPISFAPHDFEACRDHYLDLSCLVS